MRLLRCNENDLNTDELVLEEYEGQKIPLYAALSHVWDEDEVLFSHVQAGTAHHHKGYDKVKSAMRAAAKLDLAYIWIDTCCIDKSSSAELSEDINSMFTWYKKASVCIAHLVGLLHSTGGITAGALTQCRWFTRGWCLQELVAPDSVLFYTEDWRSVGSKETWSHAISDVTGIDHTVLNHMRPIDTLSIAHRMSWAANRQTTRVEDQAYCLMGIFDVNMPLLYGEGQKAFQRLQEEILKATDDDSLFAWMDPEMPEYEEYGVLAESPSKFKYSGDIVSYRTWGYEPAFEMTNRGVRIELPMLPFEAKFRILHRSGPYIAALNCSRLQDHHQGYVAILLHGLPGANSREYKRISCNLLEWTATRLPTQPVYIRQQAVPRIKDLVYPVHYFRLLRPSFHKRIQVLGAITHDPGPTVDWPSDLRQRKWLPLGVRPFSIIFKQPGKLSTVILFRWLQSGNLFVVLLGSLTALDIGFDILPWSNPNVEMADEDLFHESESLQSLQSTFRPLPDGSSKSLEDDVEITLHTICDVVDEKIVYNIMLYVNTNQPDPQDSNVDAETPEQDADLMQILDRKPAVPIYSTETVFLEQIVRAGRREVK